MAKLCTRKHWRSNIHEERSGCFVEIATDESVRNVEEMIRVVGRISIYQLFLQPSTSILLPLAYILQSNAHIIYARDHFVLRQNFLDNFFKLVFYKMNFIIQN